MMTVEAVLVRNIRLVEIIVGVVCFPDCPHVPALSLWGRSDM